MSRGFLLFAASVIVLAVGLQALVFVLLATTQ